MHNYIGLSDLTILLVEPSETQQKIISNLLTQHHVKFVESVSTITQANAFIERHQPDLVISAMYFEDGTGLELFQKLKNDPATDTIPCMLVSSEFRAEKLEEFKQAGVIAILPNLSNHCI